jgi:tartrate dehydrogenase/decarboxylase/D-malate dehydrogenase
VAARRIAVIPGDGIGTEVVPEGVRVLTAAAEIFGFELELAEFGFAGAGHYLRRGTMLPDDWFEQLRHFDALFFGAVGGPDVAPDHVSLWGSLLQFRRRFDQYVSLRPAKLLRGVASPLAGRAPGGVDLLVVRENTEGEYSSIGGRIFEGTDRETVVQETVMTRTGVDRILRYAFELARSRPRKHLTSATKSNGISISMPYWDERVAAMAVEYPDVEVDKFHIDILTAHFVLHPGGAVSGALAPLGA